VVRRSFSVGLVAFGFFLWAAGWILTVGDVSTVWSYAHGMPGAGVPESIPGAGIGLFALMPIGGILIAVGVALLHKAGRDAVDFRRVLPSRAGARPV
jgi:hypothetical protein